jgi:hypothetical protein
MGASENRNYSFETLFQKQGIFMRDCTTTTHIKTHTPNEFIVPEGKLNMKVALRKFLWLFFVRLPVEFVRSEREPLFYSPKQTHLVLSTTDAKTCFSLYY